MRDLYSTENFDNHKSNNNNKYKINVTKIRKDLEGLIRLMNECYIVKTERRMGDKKFISFMFYEYQVDDSQETLYRLMIILDRTSWVTES